MTLADLRAHESIAVEVVGHYDNAIGNSDAASQGVMGVELLRERAMLRPAEVLEYIPGMVVTQHSGDGKANQYFLRGMNLDHGTDFATTVNGVPVNMPTHAHGHGYSDLNFLIPELVQRVEYRKGPYFASDGDFSSAGSANFIYRTKLDRPFADVTIGQRGYLRGVAAVSRDVSEGVTLLSAVERLNNNGPWTVPEGIRKTNAQFILSGGSPREGWSTSLSAYSAHWNSTDQIPQRLIDAGTYQGQPFGRFDSLDPSDGGNTNRTSLSGHWHQTSDYELIKIEWYAVKYDLNLSSNFTYSLDRTNDQFAQTDDRSVWGGKAYRAWFIDFNDGRRMQNTLGVQMRQDRIRVGLYDTVSKQIQSTVRDDDVQQTLVGIYGENEMGWNSWLRTVAGLRVDQLNAKVTSHSQEQNSGSTAESKVSPKLSVIFGPWHKTEFFVNTGKGFHSNDARGTTAKVGPKTGQPIDSVPGLVSSRGQEIGMKSQIIPDLQTTLAIWRLAFDSELVYVGDAGDNEAGRPSRRIGVEWSNHWTPGEHFLMDANFAWNRPRYTDSDLARSYIANAVQKVSNLAFTLRNLGPWSGSLGVRYIGAAPLIEDNGARSIASVTANLRVNRKITNDWNVALDVLNLTGRQNNDISYYYTSRVAGEPVGGVNGVHVHPAEPRTVKLTTRMRF
ncbi:TonB-dependent receptor domain-containing protein [Limnohabitans sp.]|uniref:TonB-dependent receptor n=1 Tax=Limnohabitans sp. TaxID=1907725 RepID=UPI00286EF448|nr:TonB-dependent receptor [Limnohabitans sp.]